MIKSRPVLVAFKVDEDLYNRLNEFAKSKNMYRTDVIKNAIKEFLKKGEIVNIPLEKTKFTVTFKLDSETLMELDRIAIKYRMTRSELIRIIVDQYLRNHGDGQNGSLH